MIKSLQSLRFVMALLIFYHHFFTNPQVAQFGTFPVAFFFILSGFVMTIGYAGKVQSESFDYKQYISKRLIRLLPLNAVCFVLWLVAPVLGDIVNGKLTAATYVYAIPDLLLVQAWVPLKQIYFSGNSVAWFLSDMLFCYLLFPLLVRFLSKRWGKAVLLLLVAVYLVGVRMMEGDAVHAFVYVSPFFRVLDFMLGMVLSLALAPGLTEAKRPVAGTLLEVAAISVTVLALLVFPKVPSQYGFASLYWIPSLLLITAFALSEKWGGLFAGLLKQPFLVFLGTLSFPFYMVHKIVIDWYNLAAAGTPLQPNSVIGAVICILFTTLLAYLYVKRVAPWITSKIKAC